jgi:uncharacterized membrane-anchored protein
LGGRIETEGLLWARSVGKPVPPRSRQDGAASRPDERIAAGTAAFGKVPQVVLVFWIIKICATTLGETGGDALSMTLHLGYAVSTLIVLAFFCVVLAVQVASKRYHPYLYWIVVVATTTVGTTTSDYMDRTVGLGYVKSSVMLFCAVIGVILFWRLVTGSVKVDHIDDPRNEVFYWVTILVSNTLGTALGDFVATTTGLGFEIGALVFTTLIAIVAAAHFLSRLPASLLFWAAYVLTRPLGATLGDVLTKPHDQGGLALDRIASSLVIAAAIVAGIALTSRPSNRGTARIGKSPS